MNKIESTALKIKPRSLHSLEDMYKSIREDLSLVEKQLKLFLRSTNPLISQIGNYLFKKSGKRIRPALLILCSKLFGYGGKDHILTSTLVETIHTASLIHDDIIDNSDTRRGQNSVHSVWGPNITVLLGDYIYIKSIGLSIKNCPAEIIQILTDVSARMIEGELEEYYMSGNLNISEHNYLNIIEKKTAALFSAACRIGAIHGEADNNEKSSLEKYGLNIGMSFQIIDDLLDFTGDQKKMGKPILSDLSEGRITLPLIYSLNNNGKNARKRLKELLAQKTLEKNSKEEVLEILHGNGALTYMTQKAKEFSQKAIEIVIRFPESIFREALLTLPDYILSRNT
ncbi:MAG: polyprenyl synthetase family protein [Candidatus Aminicenantes bacterium]|nr:polyprenyl synthetase family protein [Candidatus Aminicenantes bacterium]